MASEEIASWQHSIADFNFSTEEFYKLLTAKMKDRGLPDVEIRTINLRQGGLLSKNRLYLIVRRKDHFFHICAAPFGNDYFFSWYLKREFGFLEELVDALPFIRKYMLEQFFHRPYWQLDTTHMFKLSVKHAIIDTINDILEPKGMRLSEHDQQLK